MYVGFLLACPVACPYSPLLPWRVTTFFFGHICAKCFCDTSRHVLCSTFFCPFLFFSERATSPSTPPPPASLEPPVAAALHAFASTPPAYVISGTSSPSPSVEEDGSRVYEGTVLQPSPPSAESQPPQPAPFPLQPAPPPPQSNRLRVWVVQGKDLEVRQVAVEATRQMDTKLGGLVPRCDRAAPTPPGFDACIPGLSSQPKLR